MPARGGAPAPAEAVDVLSDVLQAVRLCGALFFRTDASIPWSVDIPHAAALTPVLHPQAEHLISYHVVTEGTCWCHSPDASPVFLDEGDVVVIPHGDAYRLSHPEDYPNVWTPPEVVEFFRRMAAPDHPFVVLEGEGGPSSLKVLCGFLGCDLRPFNPVFGTLPPLLHVPRAYSNADHLGRLVDFAIHEASARAAGTNVVVTRLAELMFVEVVRRYLGSLPAEQTGWLAGLRDPVVGTALGLLHRDPERPWSLNDLARACHQSRSALADRFTHFVGIPPIQYLLRWRMQLAARMLTESTAKVAAIAAAVGYESEAAFARAFTRSTGVPPGAWRRGRRAAPAEPAGIHPAGDGGGP